LIYYLGCVIGKINNTILSLKIILIKN